MSDFSPLEKQLIYYLSGDWEDSLTPYAELAGRLGLTEGEVLEAIESFTKRGLIRRLGATLWHQQSGFKANAMVVFDIPEYRLEECGQKLARHSQVSHCYQRQSSPAWHFNLYAMVHALNQTELKAVTEEMGLEVEAREWRVLKSLHEYKKSSMRYFAPVKNQYKID